MFKCGEYAFRSGDIVDFEGLVVPCNEMVTVTLTEVDWAFNEGHTVLIPCRNQSEMTVDLKLPKGEVSQSLDLVQSILWALDILNKENPNPIITASLSFATRITSFATSTKKGSDTYQEKEAVYNLKVEGVFNEDGFKIDQRIKENRCGVNSVAFDESISFEYSEDPDAPYHVQLKNIINEYGVSGSDDKDSINLYIYSDYSRKTVAIPQFNVTDDELLEFYDFYIPCQSELIISMVK